MIKGPKAILSSAIAGALGEYFEVDADKIESNLLVDAKIVLPRVNLKEQVAYIPINSAGKSTKITLTGYVDKVEFSWAWSVGDVMWVNDSNLTISGAKFRAKLEHVERNDDVEDNAAPAAADNSDDDGKIQGSFVNPSTIDEDSAQEIETQKGGLAGFVARQVKMVIDTLTLQMVGFELRIVLPSSPQLTDDVGVSATMACDRVLAVGADKVELLSFGRQGEQEGAAHQSKLKQRVNLSSFVCGIHLEGKDDNSKLISYPLVEPFSYNAEMTRVGERFGGFLKGLKVEGLEPSDSSLSDSQAGSAVFHFGSVQIDSLMQLSIMLLAPPDDDTTSESPDGKAGEEEPAIVSDMMASLSYANVSAFHFPLSSVTLVLFEQTRFVVADVNILYRADGTVCSVEAGTIEYESDDNGRAAASQIVMTMRPAMKMTIGRIENLQIPETLCLSSPIESVEILYEGSTLLLRLDTIDIVTFSKKEDDSQSQSGFSAPKLPCNVDICLNNGMQIKKSEDGSMSKFGRFHVYGLKGETCTQVAFQCESFRNYIVSMTTISLCASLPLDQVNTVNDFIFTTEDITVKSGYSTDEWSEAFQPRKTKEVKQSTTQSKSKETKGDDIKLPFANIAELKVIIGLAAAYKIGEVKDTTLVIKAYKGGAGTTSKDLVDYYVRACLSRVPDFISNAEVLGLNIVDSTTGMLSTWGGAMLIPGFGAGAGVAGEDKFVPLCFCLFFLVASQLDNFSCCNYLIAIAGVDAIKGAVDAGKRARNAREEENYKPGDFFRGLVQAAGEATREGEARRGKKGGDGNIIDWGVGATANTTDYVVENKNRLGAAGAGGGGFLLGMALGGPVGAIIG